VKEKRFGRGRSGGKEDLCRQSKEEGARTCGGRVEVFWQCMFLENRPESTGGRFRGASGERIRSHLSMN